MHRAILDVFVPYFITNTPALAAEGITAPDIISWRQGESDGEANYLGTPGYTPLDYNTNHTAMRTAALGLWNGPDTLWILGEPTQYWNYTGPAPRNWQGINAVARYGGNNMLFVSSIDIPIVSGNEIHYTGNGNNMYGTAMFKALYGYTDARGPDSTQVSLDIFPLLNGYLDANGFNVFNASGFYGVDAELTGTALINTVSVEAQYLSPVADGADVVGHRINTINALTNATAIHTGFYNLGTEVLSVSKEGYLQGNLIAGPVSIKPFGIDAFSDDSRWEMTSNILSGPGLMSWLGATTWTLAGSIAAGSTGNAIILKNSELIDNTGVLVGINNTTLRKFSVYGNGDVLTTGKLTLAGQLLGATTGAFSGAVSMAGLTATTGAFSGALTGVTSLAMGGALTGATTGAFSGAVSMAGLTATTGAFSGAVGMTALTATTGAFSGALTASVGITNTNGSILSSVADGAGLTAHQLNSGPAYATTNLLGLYNDDNEKLLIGPQGEIINGLTGFNSHASLKFISNQDYVTNYFEMNAGATAGQFRFEGTGGLTFFSSKDPALAGNAFTFRASQTLDSSPAAQNIAAFRNNSATNVATISYQGSPGFWSATPLITQPTGGAAGTGGFAANSSANIVYKESTFTGGIGATVYTISDMLYALKGAGLLAS